MLLGLICETLWRKGYLLLESPDHAAWNSSWRLGVEIVPPEWASPRCCAYFAAINVFRTAKTQNSTIVLHTHLIVEQKMTWSNC